MTVLIVSNIYISSILDKALLRIIGTVMGAWFGYFVAAYTVNSFYFFLWVCFFISAISMYYYQISRYAYAYLLAGITAFLVIAQLGMTPGNAFNVAIWRSVEICLGVIVAAISAYCLFPNSLQDSFDKKINIIFTNLALTIEKLQQFFCAGSSSLEDIAEINLQLKKDLKTVMGMLSSMQLEVGIPRWKIDQLRVLSELLLGLMRKLNYFVNTLQHETMINVVQDKYLIEIVFRAIHHDLLIIQTIYSGHHVTEPTLQSPSALAAFDMALQEKSERLSHEKNLYERTHHLFQQLNKILVNLAKLLIEQHPLTSPKASEPGKAKQLHNDGDIIKQSIKVGLTIVLALVIWLATSWPGGINGIISSTVISIRANIYEMKGVSLQRLLGCLIGGGVALSILSVVAMDTYDLMVILFLLVWAFSYFSFKYPRYSYLGLQANIALVMTMAQEGGPPLFLGPPLERLGGIVIGIIASFIVANTLWRQDVLSLLAARLRKLSRCLIENTQQVLTKNKDRVVLHEISDLIWACRGCIDSTANENLHHKKLLKYEALKRSFDNCVLIQATIRYIYDSINRAEAHLIAAKVGIDLSHCESSINELYHLPIKDNRELRHQLDDYLCVLGKMTMRIAVTNEQKINLLAYLHALRQLTHHHPNISTLTATVKGSSQYS